MKNIGVGVLAFIGIFVTVVIAALIAAIPVWLIWNHVLILVIHGIENITLFQGFWIAVICSILFNPTKVSSDK